MNNNLKKRLMSLGVAATLATTGAGVANVKAEGTPEYTRPTYEENYGNYEEPEHSPYEDYEYVLSVCDELGHNLIYTDWVDPQPCIDGHTDGMYCLRCQRWIKEEQVIPAKHRIIYIPEVTPTCEDDGFSEIIMCGDCGKPFNEKYPMRELGHDIYTTEYVAPTCESDGHTSGEKCRRCNEVIKEETIIPAKGHTLVIEAEIEPTCESDGYTQRVYCSDCGKVLLEREIIPHYEHITGEMRWYKEPTCTEDGYKIGECIHCGMSGLSLFEKLGHNFGEWTLVKEATATTDGIESRECSRCHEKETRTIEKFGYDCNKQGHKVVKENGLEPTCYEDGYTDYEYCSECGEVLKKKEIIPHLEHITGEMRWGKKPTCTEEGYMEGECIHCGLPGISMFPATGHDYEYQVTKEPTCSETGIKTGICKNCNDKVEEIIDKKSHKLTTIKGQKPTCTSIGFTDKVECSVCGETIKDFDILPKIGHKFTTWEMTGYGDCINGAEEIRHCTECGKEEKRINPNNLMHGLVGTEAKAPTFESDGYTMGVSCLYCHQVFSEPIKLPKLDRKTYNTTLKAYQLVKVGELIKELVGTESNIYEMCLDLIDLYYESFESKEKYNEFVEEVEKFLMDFYQLTSQSNIDYLELFKEFEQEYKELTKNPNYNDLDLPKMIIDLKGEKVKTK